MVDWDRYWTIILNGQDITSVLAFATLTLLGQIGYMLFDVKKSVKHDKRHPDKFSWKYFWRDNIKRVFMNFFLLIISVLFYSQITNGEITPFGVLTGVSFDAISKLFKGK